MEKTELAEYIGTLRTSDLHDEEILAEKILNFIEEQREHELRVARVMRTLMKAANEK